MNGLPETRDPIESPDPIEAPDSIDARREWRAAPRPRRRLLMKLLGTLLVLSFPAALAWNGEKVGEAREAELALEEGRPACPANARFVPPWEWTSAERELLGPNLRGAIASLRDRIAGDGSSPAPATTAPETAPTTTPPTDFARAEALVRRGDALWRAHDLEAARTKLVVARQLLEPLAAREPSDPAVAKTLRLCNDLIDDIDKR
jgi:hypothetical protein